MKSAPLLIEIGCEEIPARMISEASQELGARLSGILERAGLAHGARQVWGGSRRLAVLLEGVQGRQDEREELVLGPPARVALDPEGRPTAAALGFAKKSGIDASELGLHETEKGRYVGFRRRLGGMSVGEVVARDLPGAVEGMVFPKSMRWGDGQPRWVRPVHWVVALHGTQVLPLTLFGVCATNHSAGHRFLGPAELELGAAEDYLSALEAAKVLADPAMRRERLEALLGSAAAEMKGELVEDAELLDEVVELVEWPGVVHGRFDPAFLELPRELLVTTLRHHQKCFSVQDPRGRLLPGFLAVANTDRDTAGHIRRGNEWVVGGRLEDARFFWREDRTEPLAARSAKLENVVFQAQVGSFADKSRRLETLATSIASRVGLSEAATDACRRAARLAKNDLVTGTVGEFPELQGMVGGLLLAAEGEAEAVSQGVYAHYQPVGPHDAIPPTPEAGVVALADKLDTTAELIRIGQVPTGSRDPFGLRRATSGIFRIVIERQWPLAMTDFLELTGNPDGLDVFLRERLHNFLRDAGATSNEIHAVLRIARSPSWQLHDVAARVTALRSVRRREDFAHLVELTKRVDNILNKNSDKVREMVERTDLTSYKEDKEAATRVEQLIESYGPEMARESEGRRYEEVIDILSRFIEPVHRFFEDVLVIDPGNPQATHARWRLLGNLKSILTTYFDIRELAGQADRRP